MRTAPLVSTACDRLGRRREIDPSEERNCQYTKTQETDIKR
jgi:hypothetical protein